MLQLSCSATTVPADPTIEPSELHQAVCRWVIDRVATDFVLDPGQLTAPTRGSPRTAFATVWHACRVVEDSRDDLWLDCRLAVLERACCAQLDDARRGALR